MSVRTLDADELDSLFHRNGDVQLVDVLPPSHYEKVHLPGSTNLPLKNLKGRAAGELKSDRPVVVYCSEPDCGMSPKAASVLEDLGFEEVYDFEGGIAEWRRSGRNVVRKSAPEAKTFGCPNRAGGQNAHR